MGRRLTTPQKRLLASERIYISGGGRQSSVSTGTCSFTRPIGKRGHLELDMCCPFGRFGCTFRPGLPSLPKLSFDAA